MIVKDQFTTEIHPEKSFFDSNKIFLNHTNLCIAIQSKITFFDKEIFLNQINNVEKIIYFI